MTPSCDSTEARQRRYRSVGWWPGERLQDRYGRASASRLDDLAVADSRGRRFTHRQLQNLARSFGAVLAGAGIRGGDVILIQLPNWAEWQAVFLGALQLGAILATVPLRTDRGNLLYLSELISARALIVPRGEELQDTVDGAVEVATKCRHAIDVLTVASGGELQHAARGRGAAPQPSMCPGMDHVMFTSSTTGRPKAVVHTADTLAALNLAFSERFALGPDTSIFMPSPLGHSVGAIHGARLSLFNASPLILQERWDPTAALDMVDEHMCAFTAAATPFLKDLVDAPARPGRHKLESMRWFLCGGAQVPPTLMDRTRDEFPHTRVTALWGMTEGGLTTCVADSPWPKRRSTCGIGLPGLETRILGADGAPLPAGAEGELAIRGPGVFIGYLGQDDLYQSLLTSDGFFRTGDLAVIDEENYLQITGRLKDLIIRGGVNISPVLIEDALAAHPNVASIAVVGIPDPRLGERICAVIEPKTRRPSLEELIEFALASGLSKYYLPEALRYVDSMPRTPAGKIRKIDLRAVAAAQAEGPSIQGGRQ